jgi:chemotaxis protein MotB
MRRAPKFFVSMMVLGLSLAGTGCVQQSKYDELVMANRSLQEQMVAVEDERDVAKANLDTIRGQLAQATSELNGLKMKFGLADEDLKRMAADYDALLKQVHGFEVSQLPPEMSSALADLAAQYPNLLTFDSKRGMLRFASDFTFALGSADLSSSAQSSLQQLATILNTATASNFEVRIVGHTDNVPISNAATKAKHPTNWHLSAHRAISVGSALISDGISPTRVQVAGCGEYRPIVANPAKGGAAQNRRVEIFLVPMSDASIAVTNASTTTTSTPTEPMK